MEPEFAVAEGADRLAVDFDVGHQQHLFVVLPDALGAGAQRLGRFLAAAEIAEIGCKAQLIVLRNLLAAEHQHQVLAPGVLNRFDVVLGQRLGEIDAADLGAASRR